MSSLFFGPLCVHSCPASCPGVGTSGFEKWACEGIPGAFCNYHILLLTYGLGDLKHPGQEFT